MARIKVTPNPEASTYFIDATNICHWGKEMSLQVLLQLLLEILRKKQTFFCIFDANTSYYIPDNEKKIYKKLLEHTDRFYQVSGGKRADDFILELANRHGSAVISNDNYSDPKYSKYKWKEREAEPMRLFMGEVIPVPSGDHLILFDLEINVILKEPTAKLYRKLTRILYPPREKFEGNVKFVNNHKGWGRIIYQIEDEVNFRTSELPQPVEQGQRVNFFIEETEKGEYARNIGLLEVDEKRIKGRIVQYDENRGMGAIKPESGGEDLFFYKSYFDDPDNIPKISKSQRVSYVLGSNSKGECAKKIQLAEEDPRDVQIKLLKDRTKYLEDKLRNREEEIKRLKQGSGQPTPAERSKDNAPQRPKNNRQDQKPKKEHTPKNNRQKENSEKTDNKQHNKNQNQNKQRNNEESADKRRNKNSKNKKNEATKNSNQDVNKKENKNDASKNQAPSKEKKRPTLVKKPKKQTPKDADTPKNTENKQSTPKKEETTKQKKTTPTPKTEKVSEPTNKQNEQTKPKVEENKTENTSQKEQTPPKKEERTKPKLVKKSEKNATQKEEQQKEAEDKSKQTEKPAPKTETPTQEKEKDADTDKKEKSEEKPKPILVKKSEKEAPKGAVEAKKEEAKEVKKPLKKGSNPQKPKKVTTKRKQATSSKKNDQEKQYSNWWKSLEKQWQMAFNVVAGNGEIIARPSNEQIKNLLKLKRLSFYRTSKNKLSFKLTNLTGLRELTQLQTFNIADHLVSNLRGTDKLTRLHTLNCNKNQLKTLKGIENMKMLRQFSCVGNELQINNFANIAEQLPALVKLDARSNNLSKEDKKALQEATKGITVKF